MTTNKITYEIIHGKMIIEANKIIKMKKKTIIIYPLHNMKNKHINHNQDQSLAHHIIAEARFLKSEALIAAVAHEAEVRNQIDLKIKRRNSLIKGRESFQARVKVEANSG